MEIIHTTVTYPMMGDHIPEDWTDIVLGHHENEGDILEYQYMDSTYLAHGLQNVKFSFKMEVPSDTTIEQLVTNMIEFITYMIGEADFVVDNMSILVPAMEMI